MFQPDYSRSARHNSGRNYLRSYPEYQRMQAEEAKERQRNDDLVRLETLNDVLVATLRQLGQTR